MDLNKNLVGKIVRVHYIARDGKEYSQTGIVNTQSLSGDKTNLQLFLTSGAEWSTNHVEITKVTSVRISEEQRTALTDYQKAKAAQKDFLDKFWAEKSCIEKDVAAKLKTVQECSEEMTVNAFESEVEKMLNERFHTDTYNPTHFWINSISDKSFTIAHVQDVEKWSTPEKYPFIYRKYDDNLFIDNDHPDLQRFCEKHAPKAVPELEMGAKIFLKASVGDKNWLSVQRCYELPLKHGISKTSLREFKALLFGEKNLDSKISDATSRVNRSAAPGNSKEKGRGI